MCTQWLAATVEQEGDRAEAESLLREGAAAAVDLDNVVPELVIRCTLAIVLADAGRAQEAQAELARIGEISAGAGDWRGAAGRVALAEAATLVAQGRLHEAGSRFEAAIDTFQRFSLPWDEALAWHRWGRSRLDDGDRIGAVKPLAQAVELYQRNGAGRPWIERAVTDKLLAQGVDTSGGVAASIDIVAAAALDDERLDLTPHAAPDGTVTLLFSDIEGSTLSNERLGDRRWLELLHVHNRIVREQVNTHEGFEVKSQGDGFMVAFSSARRALDCAIGIQRALWQHSEGDPDEPLAVRIGLHTGEVVKEGADFFGRNVTMAARVAGCARGGEILVSSLVKELADTGDISFGRVREVELKGFSGTRHLHEVIWREGAAGPVTDGPSTERVPAGAGQPAPASVDPGRPPGLVSSLDDARGGGSPAPARLSRPLELPPRLQVPQGVSFVGRADEVEVLIQAWKRAEQGARQVVFIGGEPGVGKTRLATSTALKAHAEGATVLLGTSDEDLAVPYQPFVEALRHYIAACPPDQLAGWLGDRPTELSRLVPELSQRLPGLAAPQAGDPETERYLLFEAVAGWLAAAASACPVVLILDDLHWATKTTLLMLKHILRSAVAMPLLVIGTYRDSDLGRSHPLTEVLADLRRETGVQRLGLRGLGDVEALALVEALAGHQLSGDLLAMARAVKAETDGNPYFMREILENMIESGTLVKVDERWAYQGDTSAFGIPESIREVIGRRLSRLSEDVERFLTLGAVIGTKFDLIVLSRVVGVSQSAAVEALEQASGARLVREVAGSPGRFGFANALIRDVLYEEIGPARRMELHRSVATAIEELAAGQPDANLPELAYHWLAASPGDGAVTAETTKAAEYAEKAGRQAMASLAYEGAVTHFGGALRVLQRTGERERICELSILLGEAQRCAGDPAYRETLLEAGRLAAALGDAERAARAALTNQRGIFSRYGVVDKERAQALEEALSLVGPSDTAVRARLLASLASELQFSGEVRRHELGREALAVARRLDDRVTLAQVLAATWFGTWDPDTFNERLGLAAELTALATQLGDRLLEFHAGAAMFLTQSQNGDMAKADAGLEACTRAAEQLGQPALRWRAAYCRTNRDIAAGRLAEAEADLPASDALGRAGAAPDYLLYSQIPLGVIRLLQGRPEEAVEVLTELHKNYPVPLGHAVLGWATAEAGQREQAAAILEKYAADGFAGMSRDYAFLPTIAYLDRLTARLGERGAAARLYELMLPHAAEVVTSQATWVGPAAYDLGLLAATLGRYDDAASHFAAAADLAVRIDARVMLVHTRLDWARTLQQRGGPGDRERALDLLKSALTGAEELQLTGTAAAITALMRETR